MTSTDRLEWKRRPTTAGIYVCWSGWNSQFSVTAIHLSQERIDAGAQFNTELVYGPLPSRPCEACGGLGTPSGEAAGLICGACNGTGIEIEETTGLTLENVK